MADAPVLTATRSVLDFVSGFNASSAIQSRPAGATFEQVDEDTGKVRRSLRFDYDAWVDMGRPRQVTITIEPGDRLNEEVTDV